MIEQNEEAKSPPTARLYYLPTRLTYAAVVDAKDRETEITDFMVRRACEEADKQLQYPFAPRKQGLR